MKTIAITIDEETLARIDRAGVKNRSSVFRRAVHEYLARRERAADEKYEDRVVRKHRVRLAREGSALVRAQPKR